MGILKQCLYGNAIGGGEGKVDLTKRRCNKLLEYQQQ